MHLFRIFFLQVCLLFSFDMSWAQISSQNCEDQFLAIKDSRVQQLKTSVGDCLLSVYNKKNYLTQKYRSFVFSDQSSLLVFISTGPGPDNQTTGAKEFYFFPRHTQFQTVSIIEEKNEFHVSTSSLFGFTFNADLTQLTAFQNLTATIDAEISLTNDGGVSLNPLAGVIYELPFEMGQSPSQDLTGFGVFKNNLAQVCKIQRKKIFVVDSEGQSQIRLSDADVKTIVKNNCPDFQW